MWGSDFLFYQMEYTKASIIDCMNQAKVLLGIVINTIYTPAIATEI